MRFFEIAQPEVRILATKRYLKHAAFYMKGYPAVEKTLRSFLEHKVVSPMEPWGKKDAVFTGNPALSGHRHAHLVHGKVVVLYDADPSTLRLYDIVEHSEFDTPAACSALAAYIEQAKLEPMEFGDATESLTPEQKAELDDLFYLMATGDRDILDAALAGDLSGLMEFATLAVEASPDTIVGAYGGQAGLVKHLKQIIHNIGG